MAQARVSVERLLPRAGRAGGPREDLPRLDRRRGVADLLDVALALLLRRFALHVGVTFAMLLPMQLALLVGVLAVPSALWLGEGPEAGDPRAGLLAFAWLGVWLCPWALARAFVCGMAGADLLERRRRPAEVLAETLASLPGALLIALCTAPLIAAGSCACLVPGVLAAWLLEPALPAFALERRLAPGSRGPFRDPLGLRGALRALRRAPRIAVGGPGAGGASLARWLGTTAGSLLLAAPLLLPSERGPGFRDAVERYLPESAALVVLAGVSAALQAVALAWRSVVVCVYALDQRARREGLDVELALERIERGRASGEAAA